MNNTTTPTSLGIFAAIKQVLVTICTSVIKACKLVDTSLDAAQDVADSGKVLTAALKEETIINSAKQLKLLEQD